MCIVVVQSLSHIQLSMIPWTAAHQASLSITISTSMLKLMSIDWVMPFNHLIFYPPLLLPSIFASIKVSNFTVQKHQFFSAQLSLLYGSTLTSIHDYWEKKTNIALTIWTFVGKEVSVFVLFCFVVVLNMFSRFVIAFLARSKHLLISWPQSPSAVMLEPRKIKAVTVYIDSPSICHEVMRPEATILVFWMLNLKSAFSLSTFTFINRLFSSSSLSTTGWCHLHIWGCWNFSQESWYQLLLHPAQHFTWWTLHVS